ncbi:hypothetical protein DACRYDRAFT_98327 [Dacryopinax primogenitus]|uniref:Chromatin modification-related protein n=1 Tax=Dacryopinax primogenitus (strain DJM 731) TaxID=1858805 RepID=M5GGL6_DACPD|nr:uncharacterized protein DACRYDRAFT_98327 [Dacryopinax primogenitus]EJU05703.1 hypothetical protein DACRYDRAFT_98327 [Dacryopinax primogenitus]
MPLRPRKKRRSNTSRAVAIIDEVEDIEDVEQEEVAEEVNDVVEHPEVTGQEEADGAEEEGPTEEQIEEWEAFRQEYYEIINELPVSLHRSYNLMQELDEQVEAHLALQLPAIKQYIAFRHALLEPPPAPPPLPDATTSPDVPPESSNSVHLVEKPVSSSGASTTTIDHTVQLVQSPHVNGITESPKSKKRKRSSKDEGSPSRRSPRGASESTTLSRVSSRSSQSSLDPITPDSKNLNGIVTSEVTISKGTQSQAQSKEIEVEAASVITRRMLAQIAQLSRESLRASDEKIGIAKAMYDLVDRHVRSLDAKIKEYEASVAIGLRPGTHPMDGTLTFEEPEEKPEYSDTRRGRKRDRKGKERTDENEAEQPQPSDVVINMPINAMEPTYCYCHRVSFGEMIGCDAEDCPHGGWFHLECLGLDNPPKGSFFCDDCAKERNNPKKKRGRT